ATTVSQVTTTFHCLSSSASHFLSFDCDSHERHVVVPERLCLARGGDETFEVLGRRERVEDRPGLRVGLGLTKKPLRERIGREVEAVAWPRLAALGAPRLDTIRRGGDEPRRVVERRRVADGERDGQPFVADQEHTRVTARDRLPLRGR